MTETAGVGDTVESGDGDTLVAPVPSVSPAAETPGLAAPGPIGDDAVVRAVAGVDVLGAVTAVVAGSTTLPPAGVDGTFTAGVGPSVVGVGALEMGGRVVALAPAEARTAPSTSVGATSSTVEAAGAPLGVAGGAALLAGAVPIDGTSGAGPAAAGTPIGMPTGCALLVGGAV